MDAEPGKKGIAPCDNGAQKSGALRFAERMAYERRRDCSMSIAQEIALPGFDALIETKAETDKKDVGADLRKQEFTAERLAKNYPGKYALAARAFFEKSRSAESICDILQISPQTMHALIERECLARGVFELKTHIRTKAASAAHKAVIKLQELLDDDVAIRKAGIVGLTNAIKALTSSDTPEKPKEDGKPNREDTPNEYLDMVEADGVYGFGREKISAPHANNCNECGARTPNVSAEKSPETAGIDQAENEG